MELPKKQDVKAEYDKLELQRELTKYHGDFRALLEFVWHLQNNAWTDGNEEYDR